MTYIFDRYDRLINFVPAGGRLGFENSTKIIEPDKSQKKIFVYPALLLRELKSEEDLIKFIKTAKNTGAKGIHFDIADGTFENDNGKIIKATYIEQTLLALKIAKSFGLKGDVHLMVACPTLYIERLIACGADSISLHIEALENGTGKTKLEEWDKEKLIKKIKKEGVKVGIAVNPNSSIISLPYWIIKTVDFVLLLAVVPGMQGSNFIDPSGKINNIKKNWPNKRIYIDGAMNK